MRPACFRPWAGPRALGEEVSGEGDGVGPAGSPSPRLALPRRLRAVGCAEAAPRASEAVGCVGDPVGRLLLGALGRAVGREKGLVSF